MVGAVADYQAMYDAIKNWNESPTPGPIKDGNYIYELGYSISEAPYFGWTGDGLKNERYHYEEVRKAHKALKVALQAALGVEQVETEF